MYRLLMKGTQSYVIPYYSCHFPLWNLIIWGVYSGFVFSSVTCKALLGT